MKEVKDLNNYEILLKGQPVLLERFKHDEGLYFLNPFAKFIIDLKREMGLVAGDFEYNGVYSSY